MKVQKTQVMLLFFGVLMILPGFVDFILCSIGNWKLLKNPYLFSLSKKDNQVLTADKCFSEKTATRNKKKMAALNKENCEEHPRSNLSQNSNVPRSQKDYITKVAEEIAGRVTKKLLQEFRSR